MSDFASQTPLTVTRLGELMMEAGVPDGVVNIISSETCGGSKPNHNDLPIDDPSDCVDLICDGPPAPDDSETPTADCTVCQGGSAQPTTPNAWYDRTFQ